MDDLQGRDVQQRPEPVRRVRLHECILAIEVRSDLRLCRPAYQPPGRVWLCGVHAAPARSFGEARAADRFLLRLCPARNRSIAAPRLEEALEALSELRARPSHSAVRLG